MGTLVFGTGEGDADHAAMAAASSGAKEEEITQQDATRKKEENAPSELKGVPEMKEGKG